MEPIQWSSYQAGYEATTKQIPSYGVLSISPDAVARTWWNRRRGETLQIFIRNLIRKTVFCDSGVLPGLPVSYQIG